MTTVLERQAQPAAAALTTPVRVPQKRSFLEALSEMERLSHHKQLIQADTTYIPESKTKIIASIDAEKKVILASHHRPGGL